MSLAPRHIAVFGSGLVIGIAGAWMAFGSHSPPAAPKATIPVASSQPKKPEAPGVEPAPAALATPVSSTHTIGAGARQRASCSGPLVAAQPGDGQTRLLGDVSSKTAADAAALILSGKEAVASGHPRDAEAAFLSACRIAAQAKGEDSVEYADAKYQLGRLYANVARSGEKVSNRQELAGRAELLYADSLQTYLARYGEGHEKSKFALEGLAGLRQNVSQAQPSSASGAAPVMPAEPAPKVAAAPAKGVPEPAKVTAATVGVAAAPAPAPAAGIPDAVTAVAVRPRAVEIAPPLARESRPPPVGVARAPLSVQPPARLPYAGPVARTARVDNTAPPFIVEAPVRQARGSATADARPSFDCAKARSPSEKLICSDLELAQLDRNLGRLHARAKNSTSDLGAFKRHNEAEWRRRESTCRGDRECLLDWYAHRRVQLLNEVD